MTAYKIDVPEAVTVPITEYKQKKASSDYLEDLKITEMLKERVFDKKKPVEMISMKDMEKYFENRGIK